MESSFSEWGLKSKRVLSSWGLDLDLPRPPQEGGGPLPMDACTAVCDPLLRRRGQAPSWLIQLSLPDSLEDEQVVLVSEGDPLSAEILGPERSSFGLGVLPRGAGPGSGSLALDLVLAKRNLWIWY